MRVAGAHSRHYKKPRQAFGLRLMTCLYPRPLTGGAQPKGGLRA